MCIPPYNKHSEATQSFYGMGLSNTTAYMYDGTPSDEFWGTLATYSSNGYTKSFGHSFNTSDAAFREILMARLVPHILCWIIPVWVLWWNLWVIYTFSMSQVRNVVIYLRGWVTRHPENTANCSLSGDIAAITQNQKHTNKVLTNYTL